MTFMKEVKKVSSKLQNPIIKPVPGRFRNNNQISITKILNVTPNIGFPISGHWSFDSLVIIWILEFGYWDLTCYDNICKIR
jgi:hypothetical protein